MKIKDKQLAKLDKEVGEFYRRNIQYHNSIFNPYSREIYKTRLPELLKKAEQIKPKSTFDELVLKNIRSNLNLNDLFLEFYTNPDFQMPVEEWFNKLAGEGAMEYLEQRVRYIPWEKIWEHKEKIEKKRSFTVDLSVAEAQKAIQKWIPRIKQDVLEYAKSKGILPPNFDTKIILLPPSAEYRASWLPKTRTLQLSPYAFYCFSENGNVKTIPTEAYLAVFHEVLGHAAHQFYSQEMPFSLKFTDEIADMLPTRIIAEGIALGVEEECYDFLKARKEELNIKEEEITFLKDEMDLRLQGRAEQLYSLLIKEKEKREGFNGYEHIRQLTGDPFIARRFKEMDLSFVSSTTDEITKLIAHTLGDLHYKKMLDKAERKFGKDYLRRKEFRAATLKGCWSWEVYPEAVCYMAEEAEK